MKRRMKSAQPETEPAQVRRLHIGPGVTIDVTVRRPGAQDGPDAAQVAGAMYDRLTSRSGLQPEQAAQVARLKRRARQHVVAERWIWCGYAPAVAAWACLVFARRSLWIESGSDFILPSIVLAGSVAVNWLNRTRARRYIELQRAAFDIGQDAIGPLIESLATGLEAGPAQALLAVMLPRLRHGDADLLSARDRVILNSYLYRKRWMWHSNDMPLVLGILRAYEQVGGADAIPPVERLAKGSGYGGRDPEVREAARRCLEVLRLREGQQSATATLLRAADCSAAGDALLRAAATGKSNPESLLRAGGETTEP